MEEVEIASLEGGGIFVFFLSCFNVIFSFHGLDWIGCR